MPRFYVFNMLMLCWYKNVFVCKQTFMPVGGFLKMNFISFCCIFISVFVKICNTVSNLNLHPAHMPFFCSSFQNHAKEYDSCKKQVDVNNPRCWGYEDFCSTKDSFSSPVCNGDHKGWVHSKEEQLKTFYDQADFGYVRRSQQSMQVICEPTFLRDSSLECSDHLQMCRGRNIMLNLTKLEVDRPWRYRMDVLQSGDLAGFCQLYEERITARSDHMSPLQSWAPELRNFRRLNSPLKIDEHCDVFMEKPTFIVKIDAAVNMYHHLCDFVNLYASLHVNSSHPSMFTTDVDVLIWETYPYRSAFSALWTAFTQNPVRTIDTLTGKTVCFRNLVLPLLPRMIFGLFYNTPLIYGCERSGLIKAFTQHVLHRLKVPEVPRNSTSVRVTFLSRETAHRNVMNEEELLESLAAEPGVTLRRVVFNDKMPFVRQLAVMQSTDVFIAMHGAGLTHLLFLPDWAAVFELYNCDDESCYADLARLRGIKYITWKDKRKLAVHGLSNSTNSQSAAHAKFLDYSFQVDEFLRLLRTVLQYVRSQNSSTKDVPHDEL